MTAETKAPREMKKPFTKPMPRLPEYLSDCEIAYPIIEQIINMITNMVIIAKIITSIQIPFQTDYNH